jgi:hypothetical protein
MPAIPARGRLRQWDHKLKTSLVYMARPCLKTNKKMSRREGKTVSTRAE